MKKISPFWAEGEAIQRWSRLSPKPTQLNEFATGEASPELIHIVPNGRLLDVGANSHIFLSVKGLYHL